MPTLRGEAVGGVEHVAAIIAGFRETDLLAVRGSELLAPGGWVDAVRDHAVRYIFRYTKLYSTLLRRCARPNHLRDEMRRGIQIDVLSRPLLRARRRPDARPILASGRAALERLDIPRFTALGGHRDLHLDDGAVLRDFFEESACDHLARRLAGLDRRDRETDPRSLRRLVSGGPGPPDHHLITWTTHGNATAGHRMAARRR